jgi:hypothetical protein
MEQRNDNPIFCFVLQVDTKATPPRIIWTHPYLDAEYLKANPVLTREGAQHRPVPERGFGFPPTTQSPLQQPQQPLPDPSPSTINDASAARPLYRRGESFPMSSSGSDPRRISFTTDSSSSRSMSLPTPKKRVLKKRRNPSQDLGPKPSAQADSGVVSNLTPKYFNIFYFSLFAQRWDKTDLPYQITPFVPPPRTNPVDAPYSLPTSQGSAYPPPSQFYPVDSKFADPSSYETKMTEKQRLVAVSWIIANPYSLRNSSHYLLKISDFVPDPTSIRRGISYEKYGCSCNQLSAEDIVPAIRERTFQSCVSVSKPTYAFYCISHAWCWGRIITSQILHD